MDPKCIAWSQCQITQQNTICPYSVSAKKQPNKYQANKEFFLSFCLFLPLSQSRSVINSIFPADYFRKDMPLHIKSHRDDSPLKSSIEHQLLFMWSTTREKHKGMLIGCKNKSLLKCGLFQWASGYVQQAWKACNPQPLFAETIAVGGEAPCSSGVAIC